MSGSDKEGRTMCPPFDHLWGNMLLLLPLSKEMYVLLNSPGEQMLFAREKEIKNEIANKNEGGVLSIKTLWQGRSYNCYSKNSRCRCFSASSERSSSIRMMKLDSTGKTARTG